MPLMELKVQFERKLRAKTMLEHSWLQQQEGIIPLPLTHEQTLEEGRDSDLSQRDAPGQPQPNFQVTSTQAQSLHAGDKVPSPANGPMQAYYAATTPPNGYNPEDNKQSMRSDSATPPARKEEEVRGSAEARANADSSVNCDTSPSPLVGQAARVMKAHLRVNDDLINV